MEAIVSRMKTVRVSLQQREGVTGQKQITSIPLRFIAVSATIPNIKDVRYNGDYIVLVYLLTIRLLLGWVLNRILLSLSGIYCVYVW